MATSYEMGSSVEFAPLFWEAYPHEVEPHAPLEIASAPVAGGAYVKRKIDSTLIHIIALNVQGEPTRVLCNRVKLESILDDRTQWNRHPVTCEACVRVAGT